MAERRMVAKSVIETDAFMNMPMSAQCFYFHLLLRADDDGFVKNPSAIRREVGCSEDDVKLLIAKQYIIPFESGVIVIRHWRVHNWVRADRKHPTDCLEIQALDVGENGIYTMKDCQSSDSQVTVNRLSSDSQVVDSCQAEVRLGKVRLNNNICENSEGVSTYTPYQKILNLYHEKCTSLPKVQKLTNQRKNTIKARWNEYDKDIDTFKECFEKVEDSDFLSGRSGAWSNCCFDWIMKPANFTKVLEGNYDNKNKPRENQCKTDGGNIRFVN